VPSETALRAVGQSEGDAAAHCRRPAGAIVVIVLGGATYAESDVVRRFNSARRRADKRCVALLGSSRILNSAMFLHSLKQPGDSHG
jgi:hypothetical protein